MIREIDSRTVPGTGATVELIMDTERDEFFLIFVKDAEGNNLTTIGAKTRAAAVEAFRHPFADSTTPDIFQL